MKNIFSLSNLLRPARLLAVALSLTICAIAPANSIESWSQDLWTRALKGDFAGVEEALKVAPDQGIEEPAKRLRQDLELYKQHRENAVLAKVESRNKALAEVAEKEQAGKFLEAMNAAIKVQTMSENWTADIQRPEIQGLISRADAMVREARESGQWLIAQELVVRLRLLHEDQPELFAQFQSYDQQYDEIARRVSLIAQFAPHKLYELNKALSAKFLPEREIPPYKESPDNKWQDQVKGIDQPMLREAMKLAASDHIDAGGWEPLLEGGLDAVKILGTTETISESFPTLADKAAVQKWVDAVEAQEKYVASNREVLSRADYNAVIGSLLRANQATIQLPNEVIFHEFGDGATSELERRYADSYTEIIWPARYRRFQQQVEGSFTGVGILIRNDEKRSGIMVVNPIEGAPAHRSGIKAGDLITTVDGESTAGWSLNRAVDEIMGPRQTPVTLGVEREGVEGILSVTMNRDLIPIRSVNGWWKKGLSADGVPQWDWMIDPVSRIGYVRLTSFNENSYEDLRAALREMEPQKGELNGIILDLRFNPGGLLTSAVQICNLFVPSGVIVSCEDRFGREQQFRSAEANRAEYQGYPMVVLVNEGSASASEIVAGCLQAHDAAIVIGARSFGKGSVQTVHPIGDHAQLKLTTQHYVLPPRPGETKGRLVHKKAGATDWGVNPNIIVAMSPDEIEKAFELREKSDIIPDPAIPGAQTAPAERPDVRDLVAKGIDPQLETALLILRGRALRSIHDDAVASNTK